MGPPSDVCFNCKNIYSYVKGTAYTLENNDCCLRVKAYQWNEIKQLLYLDNNKIITLANVDKSGYPCHTPNIDGRHHGHHHSPHYY